MIWGRDGYLWHGTVKSKKQNNWIARVTVFKSNLNSCDGWLNLHLQINIQDSTISFLTQLRQIILTKIILNVDNFAKFRLRFHKQRAVYKKNFSKYNGATVRQLTSYFSIVWINQIQPQFWRARFCLIREIRAIITHSPLKWVEHKENLKWQKRTNVVSSTFVHYAFLGRICRWRLWY